MRIEIVGNGVVRTMGAVSLDGYRTFMYVWFFFFKQKTAYEMRISDWSSDVCSSDLRIVAMLPHLSQARSARRQCLPRDGPGPLAVRFRAIPDQIGRASCRDREFQYV